MFWLNDSSQVKIVFDLSTARRQALAQQGFLQRDPQPTLPSARFEGKQLPFNPFSFLVALAWH